MLSVSSQIPAAILKAQWQPVIFRPRPKRLDIAALKPSWPLRPLRIEVFRNAPFEYVAQAIPSFLAYADFSVQFHLSDYDDSLQFAVVPADLYVVWLDLERYRAHMPAEALVQWLMDRLRALRAASSAPILVTEWAAEDEDASAFNRNLRAESQTIPGLRLYDWSPVMSELGTAFLDQRFQTVGASSLSAAAVMLAARDLGLRWVPAAVRPRLKCIAVDFDNTLYRGVLGEDGIDGVVLTQAHRVLQQRLVKLREEGVFLAAISKNEAKDVEQLLARRADFPVQRHHFSSMAVGWDSKASGIVRIARELRIARDSILMLDDNLGEISDVAVRLPEVRFVHSADPELAEAALIHGPDLMAWGAGDGTDRLRAEDLAAAATRSQALEQSGDPLAYLASLETRLDFTLDSREHVARLHELSQKTNQFNLALKRLSEAEIVRWLEAADTHAVTVRLSDRLSDSGIVAILFARIQGDILMVEEVCISCRALGRNLEDLMIGASLERIAAMGGGCREVAFAHATGPRNGPARDWLARFDAQALEEAQGYCRLKWPLPGLREELKCIPVTMNWKGED